MDKIEFIFIIIEAIAIFVEISLQIYEISSSKKVEKLIKEVQNGCNNFK